MNASKARIHSYDDLLLNPQIGHARAYLTREAEYANMIVKIALPQMRAPHGRLGVRCLAGGDPKYGPIAGRHFWHWGYEIDGDVVELPEMEVAVQAMRRIERRLRAIAPQELDLNGFASFCLRILKACRVQYLVTANESPSQFSARGAGHTLFPMGEQAAMELQRLEKKLLDTTHNRIQAA